MLTNFLLLLLANIAAKTLAIQIKTGGRGGALSPNVTYREVYSREGRKLTKVLRDILSLMFYLGTISN